METIDKYSDFINELTKTELEQALEDIPNGLIDSEDNIMFIGPDTDRKHLLSLVEGRLLLLA